MEIVFLLTGQTDADYLKQGMDIYARRISHYIRFSVKEIKLNKKDLRKQPAEQKKAEATAILKNLDNQDYLVLLDEYGKQYSSRDFSSFIQKKMNAGTKRLVFLVGGAWGFDESVKQRANSKLSVSRMTFPHQLIRVIFMEQLYRAFTILKNEPYHND
jgi:23S rRNA (pseudouridine1915-N3)-methyltransferase